MDDRIQRFLDGELDLDALDPQERREAALYHRTLRETLEALPAEPVPDVTGDVMARIRELEAPDFEPSRTSPASPASPQSPGSREGRAGLPDVLGWLWQPRPVRIRPVWAMAAALVAGILFYGDSEPRPGDPAVESAVLSGGTAVAHADARGLVPVRFRIDAPDASSVRLVGDFTGWEPDYGLEETEPGVWTAVIPLPPGIHEYAYVVDGGPWVTDPMAETVDDGFGGSNSRIAVLAEGVGGRT